MAQSSAKGAEEFKNLIEEFLVAKSIKMPNLGPSLRIALVGSTQSPSLNELVAIVGARESAKRIGDFLTKVS